MSHNLIRVLMFGWELPPFNSGGLGVACFGLARALAQSGIEVTFVLPRPCDVSVPFMRIIFADKDRPPNSPKGNFSAYANVLNVSPELSVSPLYPRETGWTLLKP